MSLPFDPPHNWPLTDPDWADYRAHDQDALCQPARCGLLHARQDRIVSDWRLQGWTMPPLADHDPYVTIGPPEWA